MNKSSPWSFAPVRQTIQHVIWKKDVIGAEQFIVSKSLDANLGLTPKKKISFAKTEAYVTGFVEEFVPQVVDCLYKSCSEIERSKCNDSQNDLDCYEGPFKTLQELKKRLIELDKLRAVVIESDLDDFDLRVGPAKTKLNAVIEHFLKVSGKSDALPQGSFPSSHRSRKAKDLLSYLPDEDDDEVSKLSVSMEAQNLITCDQRDETVEAIDGNAVGALNEDIAELHRIMLELHTLVSEQGEVSDSIADHVECASEHIERGNQHLKKASIAKAAIFPVVGAIVGGVVGGPIGLMAGMKIGSVASGVAMAGVAGSVVGYQGGKILKKKSQQESQADNENS